VPDPEGELLKNDILVELKTLMASDAKSRKHARRRQEGPKNRSKAQAPDRTSKPQST
jgi:hypothetical protein